jgi:hypothetical protein
MSNINLVSAMLLTRDVTNRLIDAKIFAVYYSSHYYRFQLYNNAKCCQMFKIQIYFTHNLLHNYQRICGSSNS